MIRAAAVIGMLAIGGGAAAQGTIEIKPLDPVDDTIGIRPLDPGAGQPYVRPEDLPREQGESGIGAVLRGLDKVNGHVQDFEVSTGDTVQVFGLDVALGDCRYPADNPTGDAFAYLTIWETGRTDQIFDGWMIASSPALNALDHRRYDVWVLRCKTSSAEATGGETKSAD